MIESRAWTDSWVSAGHRHWREWLFAGSLLFMQCSRPGRSKTESAPEIRGGTAREGAGHVQSPDAAAGRARSALSLVDPSWRSLGLPKPLHDLLENGTFGDTPAGHRIVALSFLADGCEAQARQEPALRSGAVACVARCLDLARRTRPASLDEAAANEGLWLSHLNLMLGAHDALGPCIDTDHHRAVSTALARRSLREATFHVPSYAHLPYRWPADQTATLASLARFDRAHGAELSREPAQRWRQYLLANAMNRALSLPWSEITGTAKGARDPRGCALSWQTRFLEEFDPELARTFWDRYKEQFQVDAALLVGFREWPQGVDRGADADSGPIVRGVGSAATALAIPAARVMRDGILADRLESTAAIVETLGAGDKSVERAASTPLAAAIRYLGRHAVPGPVGQAP